MIRLLAQSLEKTRRFIKLKKKVDDNNSIVFLLWLYRSEIYINNPRTLSGLERDAGNETRDMPL